MRGPGRRVRVAAVVMGIVLGGASCGGEGGRSVSATLIDFKIDLDPSTATSGEVTFAIRNNGPSIHEFVVFKTDLGPDQLPTTTDEAGIIVVDENGQGLELVGEVEDIEANATAELRVSLQSGKYVIVCNVPAHYQQGMHAPLTAS
jgi:uncharacterized cupredoxin-like copper-binding protein